MNSSRALDSRTATRIRMLRVPLRTTSENHSWWRCSSLSQILGAGSKRESSAGDGRAKGHKASHKCAWPSHGQGHAATKPTSKRKARMRKCFQLRMTLSSLLLTGWRPSRSQTSCLVFEQDQLREDSSVTLKLMLGGFINLGLLSKGEAKWFKLLSFPKTQGDRRTCMFSALDSSAIVSSDQAHLEVSAQARERLWDSEWSLW